MILMVVVVALWLLNGMSWLHNKSVTLNFKTIDLQRGNSYKTSYHTILNTHYTLLIEWLRALLTIVVNFHLLIKQITVKCELLCIYYSMQAKWIIKALYSLVTKEMDGNEWSTIYRIWHQPGIAVSLLYPKLAYVTCLSVFQIYMTLHINKKTYVYVVK